MKTLSSFSIGTSDNKLIAVSMTSQEGTGSTTFLSPNLARVYAAMMMAIADELEAPTPTEEPQ